MSHLTAQKKKRILIVTGEASGDLHAANMIKAARDINPGLLFFGLTGPKMREVGCETLLPYDEISVMGFIEVISRLPAIRRAFKAVTAAFYDERRPDVLVLVDFPGFNMRLARQAKKAGIPVLYYIAPKVWAWRQSRAKKLAQSVNRMAVIFPFEPDFYKPYGLKADYVGNPLLDDYATFLDQNNNESTLEPSSDNQIVGLFPGSRNNEIRYNLDQILLAAQKLKIARPDLKFILPIAASLDKASIEQKIKNNNLQVTLVEDGIYDVARRCSAVLAVSGTVTLQIALTGTPLVVTYSASSFSAAIARRVVKIPYISLVNIVAGREVVKEILQEDATPENLCAEMLQILDNPEYNRKIRNGLEDVRRLMGQKGCSENVAQILLEMIKEEND